MSGDRDALRAWLDLLAAASAIKKSVDARLRQRFGLSISRFDVLAALDRAGRGGLSAGALTARLRVTEGATTQVTAPLVEAGLVRRKMSRVDARVAIFQLTKRGQRLFTQIAEEHRRWVGEAFAALTPMQISNLRRLLGALQLPLDALREEAA